MQLTCIRQKNYKSTDATKFGDGRPLPEYSTIYCHISLFIDINFIDTWLNTFANNFLWCCRSYQDKMRTLFEQIPTEKPTPTLEEFNRNC